jgi:protein-S-isoprenylcysteine O-methyltransferase Ste14
MKYVRIILLTILIIAISIGLSIASIFIDRALGLQFHFSVFKAVLGSLFLIIGIFFRIAASLQFYNHNVNILTLKAQNKLIMNGLFSFSRNPLYIGIILIFLGCVVSVGTASGLVMWIISSLFCNWWVKSKEEKYMEKYSGDQYRDYQRKTPRWVSFKNI